MATAPAMAAPIAAGPARAAASASAPNNVFIVMSPCLAAVLPAMPAQIGQTGAEINGEACA
jgi:hypothetical protein